jgi:hypothetical protein
MTVLGLCAAIENGVAVGVERVRERLRAPLASVTAVSVELRTDENSVILR